MLVGSLALGGAGVAVASLPIDVPLDLPDTLVWKAALACAVVVGANGRYRRDRPSCLGA